MKIAPWWRARKEGRRVRAEIIDLRRKMWLGDEGAGGVGEGERDRVTFGSVGDWRLGKGGNLRHYKTATRVGRVGQRRKVALWGEAKGCRCRWHCAALLPLGSAGEMTSLAILIIFSPPAQPLCFHAVTMAAQVFDWLL